MAETHTRERYPRVAGRCPACHRESLRLYDGGHVGCSHLGCPDPSAAGNRLAVGPVQDTSTPPEGTDTREALTRAAHLMREPTSFTAEEIAVDLAEAMDEVRREPRTSLWRSFWDRLTEGGEAPGWPFEDEEPVHLVAAPSPTDDREWEALRDLAGRTARHLRTLPEQTEGRDVALAAELERAAAGSLAASPSPTAGEGRPPRDATDPLPQGRWLIDVCVECGGAVCVTDPPHRREHQSGVCRGFGCGGLRTVEVMPVPGAREEER